jgi:hypothetical protein
MTLVRPHIAQWYRCRDTGQLFEVVSTDDADKTVELQDYDGNLDEIELSEWYALHLEAVDPPSDLNVFDIPPTGEATGGEGDLDDVNRERYRLTEVASPRGLLADGAED